MAKKYHGQFTWKGKTYQLETSARHGAEAMHFFCKQLAKQIGIPVMELLSHYADVNRKKEYTIY